jgi:hypothetical protein
VLVFLPNFKGRDRKGEDVVSENEETTFIHCIILIILFIGSISLHNNKYCFFDHFFHFVMSFKFIRKASSTTFILILCLQHQ